MVYGALYSLSSGTSHSAQYGLAAMLKAANEGRLDITEAVKEYGEKAKIMKKMFTDKVVPIANRLPFFFKPIQDGMDKPKTELAYRVPASKITKKNMYDIKNL